MTQLLTLADTSAAIASAKAVFLTVIIGDREAFALKIPKGEARKLIGHVRKLWGRKAVPQDIHASQFGTVDPDGTVRLGGL